MPIPDLFRYRTAAPGPKLRKPAEGLYLYRDPVAPAAGVPEAMRPPPGMVRNPAATNFGRLATPRTDLPEFVAAEQAPRGIPPAMAGPRVGEIGGGIDVRSYVGSRYAPYSGRDYMGMGPQGDSVAGPGVSRMPEAMRTATGLPTGNVAAKQALLQAAYPNANRSQIHALGEFAHNRPGEFNTGVERTMQVRNGDTGIRQQIQEQGLERGQLALDEARTEFQGKQQRQQAETGARTAARTAFAASSSPSVNEAEKIRAGAMAAEAYVTAGGEDAQIASMYRNMGPRPGPSLRTLGTDSTGRAVEGIEDAQGNFSRIAPPPERPAAPGANGVVAEEVPGAGTVVRDRATGELVDSGKVIRRPESTRDPAEVTFRANLDVALSKLDEFEQTVKGVGNWETRLGNPKSQAALDQLPYQLAILTAKIVDPASVAREGEVAAAQKYLLPAGFFTTNKQTLAAIANLRNTFEQYSTARDRAQNGSQPGARTAAPEAAAGGGKGGTFKDADGEHRIITVRGQRGVIKEGKFFPIVE